MKESVEIAGFLGMVGSSDPRDLEPGMAAYAKNLNIVKQHGVMSGIPADVEGSADSGFNSVMTAKFQDAVNDTEALALFNGTNLKYSIDYNDATPASTNPLNGAVARSSIGTAMAGDGLAVHIGFGPNSTSNYIPLWLGYVGHEQIGNPGGTGIRAEPLELETPPIYTSSSKIATNPDYGAATCTLEGPRVKLPNKYDDASNTTPWTYDNSQNIFGLLDGQQREYVYYASSVYDGYQEGPLKYVTEFRPHKTSCRLRVTYSASGNYGHELVETLIGWVPNNTTVASGGEDDETAYSNSLWQYIFTGNNAVVVSGVATGVRSIEFTLWLRISTNVGDQVLNRRVTAIRIYRAERIGGQEGRAYFLKEIDINDAGWYWTTDPDLGGDPYNSDALTNGGYVHYNFLDESFTSPDDYESLNDNVPADLGHMHLRWGLSAAVDGYHIVGNCWIEGIGEAYSWLVRSKRHKFDVFDWSNDFLTLPTKPTALVPFNGRLYAFTSGRTYVINVNLFDVESTVEGIGCISHQSACVTDQGMFWVDKNNIYHHDGTRINVIGRPVLKNDITSDAAWESVDFSETPICCYHPVYESFIVFYKAASGAFVGLMYHIPTRRWQHISLSVTGATMNGLTGLYYTTEGIPALIVSTTVGGPYVLFLFEHASNKRGWDFYAYQMRTANREKYFHAKVIYNGTPPTTVEFFEDDPDYSAAQTATVVETINSSMRRYKINTDDTPPWGDVRSFSIRMAGSTGAEDVRHISLIRKRLRET